MTDRYIAKSVDDDSPHWPAWFVADMSDGEANVTAALFRRHIRDSESAPEFMSPRSAKNIARIANMALTA